MALFSNNPESAAPTPSNMPPNMPESPTSTEKITTMPENFLQPVKIKKPLPWIFLVAGGAAVVLIAALGAYFFLQPKAPEAPQIPASNQNNTTPPPATDTPTTQPTPPTTNVPVTDATTPIARDQQRYFDIGQIRTALDLYFGDNSSYPLEPTGRPLSSASGALTSVGFRNDSPAGARIYLKQVPNPPAGDVYFYQSKDGKDYSLTFTFENGIAKLAAGTHHASRTGMDVDGTKVEDSSTKTYRSSVDTDNDGLTDVEEDLYGTDAKKADTDADGYADGHEIENNYNPLIKGNARWRESGKVSLYTNPTFKYTLIYPSKWTTQSADIQNKEVDFISSDDQQFISVTREDNSKGLTPLLWYQGLGKKDWANLRSVTISGLSGLVSPDGLNLYLGGGAGKPIYIFSYHPGTRAQLDYFFTFTMMQNSFMADVKDVTTQTITSTGAQPVADTGARDIPPL